MSNEDQELGISLESLQSIELNDLDEDELETELEYEEEIKEVSFDVHETSLVDYYYPEID